MNNDSYVIIDLRNELLTLSKRNLSYLFVLQYYLTKALQVVKIDL